jgi:hypothetical protein
MIKKCHLNNYLKQRFDFGVESPPLPVSQLQIGGAISLKNTNGVQLLGSLGVVPASIKHERNQIFQSMSHCLKKEIE